jgi:hypothetical protein
MAILIFEYEIFDNKCMIPDAGERDHKSKMAMEEDTIMSNKQWLASYVYIWWSTPD